MKKNFEALKWKEYIPKPICDAHPEYAELYERAWEIARDHVRFIKGMPQNPYMDEAFCDTQLWIWDTCFMSQFCKFAQEVFPGVETFKNFYEVLYDGKCLPKIIPSANEPEWTGAVPGEESDIYIHISDNPPLFAWGEYENALFSGDVEHIKDLLLNKKYLQKHYEWFDNLTESVKLPGTSNDTCLKAEDIGYRWEGGRSGMDNTPRGRTKINDGCERPNNPKMLWIDAICQQALSAKLISELYKFIGCKDEAEAWNCKYIDKKETANRYYWDDKDGFYYDIDVNDHHFYKVKTIASFWTLVSGIASKERAARLIKYVSDPETFGGDVPLVSLARNDGDYHSDGRYWRGSLWLPTAYAALKGISEYGFHSEAHDASVKILNHMVKTYREFLPHTIWECYSPERHAPALVADGSEFARQNFCGWSALGPISIYIEYILGFRKVNAFENTVEWIKPNEFVGRIGIENLRFGDAVTDIVADGDECVVRSNSAYKLIVNGTEYIVNKGVNRFKF